MPPLNNNICKIWKCAMNKSNTKSTVHPKSYKQTFGHVPYYIYIYQYHLSISTYFSQMPNFPSSIISTPNFQPAIVERQLSQQHPGRPHRCARSWKKQRARSSLRCSTARTRGRSVWARFLEVKRLRVSVSAINYWYDIICISKLRKQRRVMD